MRFSIVAAAAVALVCLGSLSAATPAARHGLAFSPMLKGASPAKPPAAAAGAAAEDDSCRWANDRECDEPGLGTGACPAGTDRTDCIRIRSGVEDDSCQWAHDGECDEPGFGTGACTQGTDHSDCGAISWMRFQNDSCTTAFDGVCDEPGIGTGHCGAHTDRRDCFGAKRPLNINDHFFGNDDRVFVDRTQAPWRSVGRLRTPEGGVCTATLIGPNVLITAAHCIYAGDRVNVAGATFETAEGFAGGPYQANVIGYWTDPRFDYRRFTTTNDIDGMDWTLLRLDQPLGDRVGYLGVFDLTELGQERTHARDIFHAGYSWDLQGHLGAHLGCHIVTVYPDNTFAHECDTTRGDSGSPFMVRDGETYRVIGTDSNFRANPHGPALYIAVSENAWGRYLGQFTAGRIGHAVAAQGKRR